MSFHPAMTSTFRSFEGYPPKGVDVRLLAHKVELPVAAAPESVAVAPVRPRNSAPNGRSHEPKPLNKSKPFK